MALGTRVCSASRPSVARFAKRFDPFEQRRGGEDVVAMPRDERRDLPLDRFDRTLLWPSEIEEDRVTLSSAAAPFERFDQCYELAASGLSTIATISRRASSSATSKAVRKCAGSMAKKGGASNGPVQGLRRGLSDGSRSRRLRPPPFRDQRAPGQGRALSDLSSRSFRFRDAVENASGALERCAAISELT